jgi:hypothetical protein
MKIGSYTLKAPAVAFLIIAAALGAGCAKIAAPLPPEVLIPRPAADLAAFQRSDSVILTVSKPVLNTDGSPATTFHKLQVLRLIEAAGTGESGSYSEEQFLKRAAPVLSIPSSDFSNYLYNGSFIMEDTLPSLQESGFYSSEFRYAVLFINKKNQAAGISNQVRMRPVAIPPPPEEISIQTAESAIRLRWTPPPVNMDGSAPPRIAGYNIYKSEEPEEIASMPVNTDPVQGSEYEDRNFQFDRTYYYAIRTVGSLKDPYAESGLSKIHRMVARDIFPPAAPGNFDAVYENNSVILHWRASSSQDVAGYRLYRTDRGSANPKPFKEELITALSYRDSAAVSGKTYEYILHAVDMRGNKSEAARIEFDVP